MLSTHCLLLVMTSFGFICDTELLWHMELSLFYTLSSVLQEPVRSPLHIVPAEQVVEVVVVAVSKHEGLFSDGSSQRFQVRTGVGYLRVRGGS